MNLKLALFGVLIAGSAIGYALPDLVGESPAAPASADRAELPTLALASVPASDWAEPITLRRAGDGHFYADVAVEGQATRMLVDTGASVIALTGADANAIGLTWDDSAIAVVAQGANGPVYGVQTRLAEVELGGVAAQDVPALIIPEGLAVSLLGQSFLSQIGKVEISGDTMMLGEAE